MFNQPPSTSVKVGNYDRKLLIGAVTVLVVGIVVALFVAVGGFSLFKPKIDWVRVQQFEFSDYPNGMDSNGNYIGVHPENNFNTTTEQFSISGAEWKIKWDVSSVNGGSYFKIDVFDVYTDKLVKEIETPYLSNSGESYLNQQGRFYLHIYIIGTLEKWAITIEDFR